MKKQLLFAALTLAMTAGCSKDKAAMPDATDAAIGFKTYVPKATRGTVIGNANELKSTDFDVFAFKTADGAAFMGTSASDGVRILYKGEKWDYDLESEKAYWSADAVNFYAVSPEKHSGLTKNFTSAAQTLAYTVPGACDDQADLMYASVLGADRDNRNGAGKGQTTGGVPFSFKHALAQVVFKAKTAAADFKVDIESVEVCNVLSQGTFTFATEAWTATSAAVNYAAGIPAAVTGIGTTARDLTTTANGALLLLPQTLTKWTTTAGTAVTLPAAGGASYLKIMCKIINTVGGDSYLWGDASTYKAVYIPFGVTWAKGSKYTYTLIFGNTSGQAGGGGFDENGEPVLRDLQITFLPTVETWTDQTGNNVDM